MIGRPLPSDLREEYGEIEYGGLPIEHNGIASQRFSTTDSAALPLILIVVIDSRLGRNDYSLAANGILRMVRVRVRVAPHE